MKINYFLLDMVNLPEQPTVADNSDFAIQQKTDMLPRAAMWLITVIRLQ